MNDDIVSTPILESGSYNSDDLYSSLSVDNDNTIDSEPEEQEEQSEVDTSNIELYLSDIYDELTDIHSEIVVLYDSINNVALCVEEFANVFVELFVIFVFMVLIKTVIDNLLHFFK